MKTRARFVALGLALGAGVGAAIGNVAVGVALGVAFGAAMDAARNKRDAAPKNSERDIPNPPSLTDAREG